MAIGLVLLFFYVKQLAFFLLISWDSGHKRVIVVVVIETNADRPREDQRSIDQKLQHHNCLPAK